MQQDMRTVLNNTYLQYQAKENEVSSKKWFMAKLSFESDFNNP